jgi:hypothetical protein
VDLNSALNGAILIVLCLAPFIYMSKKRKILENNLLKKLNAMAEELNCNISEYEINTFFVIGIDIEKKYVFHYYLNQSDESTHCINLSMIKSCKLINTSHSLTNNGSKCQILDKLELKFISKKPENNQINLLFFNSEISVQNRGELKSAERWVQSISNLIN